MPKSKANRERNIQIRSGGYSFRVRMKIGNATIDETFFTLEEARAYRDLLRAGKATDAHQEKVLRAKAERKKAAGLTVRALLERYLCEVTPNKKSASEESYAIKRLLRIENFSNLPAYVVDGDAIERLVRDFRSNGLSNTTIRKYLMLLSSLFKVAETRRWCTGLQNPIKTIELPRAAKMRSRRFEPLEWKYLSAELAKARNPQALPFIEFLIETGCRRGEALRLRVMDIDVEACTAALLDTKNGDDRIIGLSKRAIEIIKPLLESDEPARGNVIPMHGKDRQRRLFKISEYSLRFAFEEAKKRAQLAYRKDCAITETEPSKIFMEDIRLHDCRREATSRMFEKGLDLMEVASMTGHKTLSMLQGYTALRASNLAKKLG